MWSVGVILYTMLCGYTPFMEESQDKMFERVKRGEWTFEDADWSHISEDAKDLIRSMIEPNVDARITANRALRSRWINKDAKELSTRDLSQTIKVMKERRPRLRDLARAFMALGLSTKNALKELNPIASETGSQHVLT
jgi:serine/threonine protein kinase